MEMHQVRYFLAMSRTLNFTRAADACGVSQPTLTRGIQKLEEEFEGPLFRRERSRTHLTDLGRLMLPHLERTFEACESAKAIAQGVKHAQVAPLALGVAAAIESDALSEVLAEIGENLPGFDLSIVTGTSEELIELGLNGSLDLLVVEAPDDAPDRFEAWQLFTYLYHMVTRRDHRLAGALGVNLRDVRDETWIDCGGDGATRLRQFAEAIGFLPNFRHRASSPAHLKQLILAGLGSAFMPPVKDERNLVALRFLDIEASRQVVLAAIAGRQRSVAANAFVRAARTRKWDFA
jgi:DNA-binding transcriptional LysR family regulator